MRILLDESRPGTLSKDLSDAVVESELDRGWSGLKHGERPTRAAESVDLFVTADQNLPYQENPRGHGIAVLVPAAVSDRVTDFPPLIPTARSAGDGLADGEVVAVRPRRR